MRNYLKLFCLISAVSANEFITGNNFFTADLYKEVGKTSGANFLVSPFSAEIISALGQAGAAGTTAEELRTGLRLPENIEPILKNLLPNLVSQRDYSLRVANKVYVQKDFSIKDDFRRIAKEVFSADLEKIDFSNNLEAAKKINEWVEKQTESRIRDLVNPTLLNKSTRMMLINALYFKANWSVPFSTDRTRKADFWHAADKVVQVDTMRDANGNYKYYANKELRAEFLEIPFIDESVTMTIVLPEELTLTNIENNLGEVFSSQNYNWEFIDVAIPKFKIENTVDVRNVLEKLGVKKAFTHGEADFSRISDQKLVIDDVLQKTIIDVNEGGVEAAAATEIRIVDWLGWGAPRKLFHADHPFIFYIKIRDLILFAGRVTLPTY